MIFSKFEKKLFEPDSNKSTIDLLKIFDNYMKDVFEIVQNETGCFILVKNRKLIILKKFLLFLHSMRKKSKIFCF